MLHIVSYEKNNNPLISAGQAGGEIPSGSPWGLSRNAVEDPQDDAEENC
jgi:hypothetical protein